MSKYNFPCIGGLKLGKAVQTYEEFPNRETLEWIAQIITWNGIPLEVLPDTLVAELVLENLLDE